MFTQRYMAQYGATEEDFGRHVVTQRYHASMNDDAIFREPMTMDDYLASRYVSKPLRILDCDYPVDSGSAVIFTTEERARDLDQPVVLVDSYALTAIRDLHFEIMSDMVHTAPAADGQEPVGAHRPHPGRRRHRTALRRLLDHRVPVARGARVLRRG